MNPEKEKFQLQKKWPQSQLMTSISCLTYGISCLYFDRGSGRLISCLISIHEEFINILHVIVEGKFSILFELQNIVSISDKDIFVRNTLRELKYDNFIILYGGNLENYVLVMQSQNQKDVIWEGIQYFVHQAQNFYHRISNLDPFKAEATMLFLQADVDGSSLLDIDEITAIFKRLKINCDTLQIENSILEINNDLYERQNLSKPKGFSKHMLTPLGFQYLLRYYSMKVSLAPLFSEFCPIFKFKHKKFKKTIIDILKSQNKPLMSGLQLQEFIATYLKEQLPERECVQIIKRFPVYDGEGKEVPEEVQFTSFNNFCNFVMSMSNSLLEPDKTNVSQDMSLPLTEYFIYSSSNTYLSNTSLFSDSKLQMYENSLKKGCRCLELDIQNHGDELVVKHKNSKNHIRLADVLTTIKTVGFNINPFPIILSIEINFPSSMGGKVKKIFQQELGEALVVLKETRLPSPLKLQNRIILQGLQVSKKPDNIFLQLFSLIPAKFDFERKGYTNLSTCQIKRKQILKFEEIQNKNLVDYCRKVMVRTLPSQSKNELQNYDPIPMFRNGVQIISFNLQLQDEHHFFIHSKFLENGGKKCGYLLKPSWLRSNCHQSLYPTDFNKPQGHIRMKVYAGQKIVLAPTVQKSFTLEVSLKGIFLDEKKNKKFTSEPTNEGFYSDFQMECEFVVYCIDLAHLVFKVTDNTGALLSYRAIGVSNIREGLRTVQLLGPGMELCLNSCLIVHYRFIEEQRRKRKASEAFN